MMYSSCNEAYNTSNKMYSNNSHDLYQGNSNFDNYNDNYNNQQSYFTAQGDIETPKNCGTKISSLKENENKNEKIIEEEEDNESLFNSYLSEKTNLKYVSPNGKYNKYAHDYFVKHFLNTILNNRNDTESINSAQDGEIYKHVRTCENCKNKINNEIKNHYMKLINKNINNNTESKIAIIGKSNYDIREILIIICIGVIIIFILDILFKLSKKIK